MSAKEKQRYGVQVVYFGGISVALDERLFTFAGRISDDRGTALNKERRRDHFWKCFDTEDALALRLKFLSGLAGAVEQDVIVAVKTEEQHWDEKIKAALGNGKVAP